MHEKKTVFELNKKKKIEQKFMVRKQLELQFNKVNKTTEKQFPD